MHHGHHQLTYVVFSVLVAVLGSWTALDLQRQVRAHSGRIKFYWLCATSVAMGLSIFSMHFIAMLGFNAGMPVRYDPSVTIGSLVLAIAATAFAFIAVQRGEATKPRVAVSGVAMGSGIALMHYMGMAAMRAPATLTYEPWLVAGSFAIAVVTSWAALAAALAKPRLELRLIGALVLGLAICSMHYIAMMAVSFKPTQDAVLGTGGLDQMRLALWVGFGTVLLLFFALVSAMFDRRFEALAVRESNALASREAHLREVLTRMPLAVLVVTKGPDEHVSFCNALAVELLGEHHPASLRFTDLEQRELPPEQQPFLAAVRNGTDFDHHLVGFKPLGSALRYLEISAASLAEEVILTAQDVTSRIEAEQALQQSQKLETIGHLTGGVAHDFNNLLTPIIGGLDLLQRDESMSPRSQRIVDSALQASNKAATLVQRLLAFSRRQMLQPKPVDMSAIVHGLRDLIERSIGSTIQVIVEGEPGLIARIDPGQFELAILNLAVNARDAMPDGGRLTINVSSPAQASAPVGLDSDRYVRVTVADTGVGMDDVTVKRAIEPFFSTKGLGKGTGLGLSMVHGLAAQSNGMLRMWSEPGVGTHAELWFPRSDELVEPMKVPEAPALKAVEEACILVVDDEELVRSATGSMLREIGYDVVEASSGHAALLCLEREPDVALIVTDHLMPGMTGASLARAVRRKHPAKPVLIITGYANPDELPKDLPTLRKPFLAEDLGRRVEELLTARSGGEVVSLASRRASPGRRQN